MQITTLDQLSDHYLHVYLSPHLDDAALSSGGAILQQRAAGEAVLVVTICTAAPPPEGPFNALAQRFHADWGLGPDQVVSARLEEDRAAMERLGVDYLWAERLDAIYRSPEVYDSRDALFSPINASNDRLLPDLHGLLSELAERLPHAVFYAPLAIGYHVDHQITHRAALETLGDRVLFYEDIPYVNWPNAIEQRMGELAGALSPQRVGIGPSLAGKLESIAAYASQLNELFGSPEGMRASVTAYAQRVRPEHDEYGEQQWHVKK
ncbi:MAG TPA: PIG-L family deacetylase [Roseiflexaceae bacterium]|nr:PIG-L family deacetylase [Roseiflexaceae bacterium]